MWKFLSWTFRIVLALGLLAFAGAAIAPYLGLGRLIPHGSGLAAAVFAGLYLIGAVIWEIRWLGRSRGSNDLPSSVTQAIPPPGPEYYEQPLPKRQPPVTPPSRPAPRPPPPSA